MNETLKIVLSLSLSGALLILILCLLRPLFKGRLSKRWQYYIWLVVVARLLLPFAPEANLMRTLFQTIDTSIVQTDFAVPQGSTSSPTVDMPQVDGVINGQSNTQIEPQEPTNSINNPMQNIVKVVWQNLWLGWVMVALILIVRKITIYQSFVKYIRAGCAEVADIDLLERFGNLVEKNGVKTAVELQTNNLISSPLLIGFFRPCIVLPSVNLSATDFEYTILHELTHYKRRDMFYKWLVQLTICIHWFNPLVYLMGKDIGRVCELSCDEAVIRALDPQGRRAYGDTLLNAMGTSGSYKNSLASVTLNESKELLKERLDSIMKFKKKSKSIVAITLVLTTMLCIGATAVGAYAAPQTAIPVIQSEQQNANSYIADSSGNITIPISIKSLDTDAKICIGEIPNVMNATGLSYDVQAKSGTGALYIGIQQAVENPRGWYNYVGNKEKSKHILMSDDEVGGDDSYTGNYMVCIGSRGGTLSNITGTVTIQYSLNMAEVQNENTSSKQEQQITSTPSPMVDGNLTLVTKEYSLANINSLNISGIIVKALSENVSIIRGGNTLKVEYYIRNQNDYTLKNESDAGGTFEELVLRRVTSVTSGDTERPISITIPDSISFKVISATTSSGNITLKNCSGENVISQTQSGDITINGGFASNVFAVETESGNANISDFSANEYGIDFQTKSGTIIFNDVKYKVNANDIKKEDENGILLSAKSNANDAERDAEYDALYDAGGIVTPDIRKLIHETELEAHREAHPGISYENCPECRGFSFN